MNERIRQLAEQAGFSKDKYDLYWDDDANAEGVDLEKFAELIVLECASIADSAEPFLASDLIKEHFGVDQ